MKKRILLMLLGFLLLLSACSNPRQPVARDIFAMDTYMTLTAYGKDAEKGIEAAVQEINRLDALWSVGRENSEISRINCTGSGPVSPETGEILSLALDLYQETEGALDITIFPVMKLWGFTEEEQHVPAQEALREALDRVGADRIVYDGESVTLAEGQGLDFGAIAKGYTSTHVMQTLQEAGVSGAIISLGGNVQCMGHKPDGSEWRIGIRHPEEADTYLGILTLTDKAVITSGGYERYFEEDGKTYHHILDPETGYPADSGLASVTIISADGALADALSTACFVMGKERAAAFWQAHKEDFDMILMTTAGELYITEPLEESFTTDLTVKIIS